MIKALKSPQGSICYDANLELSGHQCDILCLKHGSFQWAHMNGQVFLLQRS